MENETHLRDMSRKEALLALGEYASEHFGPVVKPENPHYGCFIDRRDAREKCHELAEEFDMDNTEFYMFMRYKLQLFEQVEHVNNEVKKYLISVIDILRVIGQVKKSKGDAAARKFINRFSRAKGDKRIIVLASAAFNTEYVNGVVKDNPKGNVFTGHFDNGDVKFIIVESNASKAKELREKLKNGSVKVLLDKPKPGSTKYNTVRLIMEN